MNIKSFLGYMYNTIRTAFVNWKICNSPEFEKNRIAAELLRNSHSIEKGQAINPERIRLGFGVQIRKAMPDRLKKLSGSSDPYHAAASRIATDALRSYMDFHDAQGFEDAVMKETRSFLPEKTDDELFAGTMQLDKSELNFDADQLEHFFKTRHSIRDFDNTPVDEEKILRAVKMAQSCPSACNRQGVRVYAFHAENAPVIQEWLKGTGGFEGDVQEFLLVTGKQSAYKLGEQPSWMVSASMFAAYLALALHAVGLGACIVQRSVSYNPKWISIRSQLHICGDEQPVCILGMGNLKDKTLVPVSKRLPTEVIYKRLL